jgi:hypothetical protein
LQVVSAVLAAIGPRVRNVPMRLHPGNEPLDDDNAQLLTPRGSLRHELILGEGVCRCRMPFARGLPAALRRAPRGFLWRKRLL